MLVMLASALTIGQWLHRHHIYWIPESGATMCCRDGYVLVDGFCRESGQNVGAYVLKGARCNAANGTTVATLEVKEHFFRFSPESTSVYRCPEDDDACRGSSPGLEGYGNGLCKTHAHGPQKQQAAAPPRVGHRARQATLLLRPAGRERQAHARGSDVPHPIADVAALLRSPSPPPVPHAAVPPAARGA